MRRCVQVAFLGGNPRAVSVGLRDVPCEELILVCLERDKAVATDMALTISKALGINVYVKELQDPAIDTVVRAVGDIVRSKNDKEVVLNIGSGDKYLTCAATVASYIFGLRAYEVMDDELHELPVIKLSYTATLSKPKIRIIKALKEMGGKTDNLSKLCRLTGYSKPLISYHLRGNDRSEGLVKLNLVSIRNKGRKVEIELTPQARIIMEAYLEERL